VASLNHHADYSHVCYYTVVCSSVCPLFSCTLLKPLYTMSCHLAGIIWPEAKP